MSDDFDDEFDDDPLWPMLAAGGAALVATATIVWFVIGAINGDGDDESVQVDVATTLRAAPDADESTAASSSAETAESDDAVPDSTDLAADSSAPPSADSSGPAAGSSGPAADSSDAVTTVDASSDATLADGSPVPVLAIFDDELITLSGVVPSEAAIERLRIIALANSTVADAQVASFLTVDPEVPLSVGVRVIELNSARFDEDSPTIPPAYIAQLDRVASLMISLPNVTVEVIGHTDQNVDEESSLQLSTDRARATADYLASQGIDAARLTARGVGADDLLTLDDDEAALALNRRTEFVFYGLLADEN